VVLVQFAPETTPRCEPSTSGQEKPGRQGGHVLHSLGGQQPGQLSCGPELPVCPAAVGWCSKVPQRAIATKILQLAPLWWVRGTWASRPIVWWGAPSRQGQQQQQQGQLHSNELTPCNIALQLCAHALSPPRLPLLHAAGIPTVDGDCFCPITLRSGPRVELHRRPEHGTRSCIAYPRVPSRRQPLNIDQQRKLETQLL
jgi:hypothetical protein